MVRLLPVFHNVETHYEPDLILVISVYAYSLDLDCSPYLVKFRFCGCAGYGCGGKSCIVGRKRQKRQLERMIFSYGVWPTHLLRFGYACILKLKAHVEWFICHQYSL